EGFHILFSHGTVKIEFYKAFTDDSSGKQITDFHTIGLQLDESQGRISGLRVLNEHPEPRYHPSFKEWLKNPPVSELSRLTEDYKKAVDGCMASKAKAEVHRDNNDAAVLVQ